MSPHTPGPWESAHGGVGDAGGFRITEQFVMRPCDDVSIAADIVDPETGEPSLANARLIAAAPDLLAALVRLVFILDPEKCPEDDDLGVDAALAAARDAIVKATK